VENFVKADLLEGEFSGKRVPYQGGLLLLEGPDAIALVRRATEEGVPILGVNCLILSDNGTREPSDQIADYSPSVREGHGCWEAAEAHIATRIPGPYVFEVVLGDDPVEAV
jgi:hypothetical protein